MNSLEHIQLLAEIADYVSHSIRSPLGVLRGTIADVRDGYTVGFEEYVNADAALVNSLELLDTLKVLPSFAQAIKQQCSVQGVVAEWLVTQAQSELVLIDPALIVPVSDSLLHLSIDTFCSLLSGTTHNGKPKLIQSESSELLATLRFATTHKDGKFVPLRSIPFSSLVSKRELYHSQEALLTQLCFSYLGVRVMLGEGAEYLLELPTHRGINGQMNQSAKGEESS